MKGKMLSFTRGLSANSEAFAVFVTEKYLYENKKDILSNNTVKRIDSYLSVLKVKDKRTEKDEIDLDKKMQELVEIEKNNQLNNFSTNYFNQVKNNIKIKYFND